MKINPLLFLVLLLLMCAGCLSKKDRYVDLSIGNDTWSRLTIVSEHRRMIKIDNNNDTSIIETHHIGSIFTGRPKVIKIDTSKVYFTKAEKDTLFNLSQQIVSYPVLNNRHCNDFVGDLDVIIRYYGDTMQQIDYSGVCDWSLLSDDTKQLHEILKRKMKDTL